jgi:hypothetical protein
MTPTIEIIVNALLAVGVVSGLVLVTRAPFRLERPLGLTRAVYVPEDGEQELSRAA